MAHSRQVSVNNSGIPHSVSLKVLRLSRPSLATQTPIPQTSFGNGLDVPADASFAFPSRSVASSSIPLAPALILPPTFGAAYVGETFTCTLCTNNELRPDDGVSVSGVRVVAELQVPGKQETEVLELGGSTSRDDADDPREEDETDLRPGETLQQTVRRELKEEGQHILSVTVQYTETVRGEQGEVASGGKARTFRKLYRFTSQQLIAVRSKVTERKRRGKEGRREWVLEAQLENVGETAVVLEKVFLGEKEGISSMALKEQNAEDGREATVLKPNDVEQVMFVLFEEQEASDLKARTPLAQLKINWRSAMGEPGSLTTGWLASRGR